MSIAFTTARRLISRKRRPLTSLSLKERTEKTLLDLVSINAADRCRAMDADAFDAVDQSYLVELACREDLAPLVHRAMSQSEFWADCGYQVQRFQYMYHVTSRRNARALQQLAEALQGFQAAGIEPLVLKGAALARNVYQDPGLRPFADMDILVKREALQQAHQVFQDLGYRLNYLGQPISAPSSVDLKYRSARQYFHRNRRYMSIDLYWQLSRYPYLVTIENDGLWERATRVSLEGASVLVPSPEDEILHLSLDFILGIWYGRPEVKALRDIAEIAYRCEVKWEALSSRVSHSALAAPLYSSCRLSKELLGADIPPELFSGIHPKVGCWQNLVARRLERHIFGTGHPLEYAFLVVLMRLSGPESYFAKFRWIVRLLVPPKSLWGSVNNGVKRLIKI